MYGFWNQSSGKWGFSPELLFRCERVDTCSSGRYQDITNGNLVVALEIRNALQ